MKFTVEGIREYLSTEEWAGAFDSATLQRGRRYFREGRVGEITAELYGEKELGLRAEVFGSQAFAYVCEVVLWTDADGHEHVDVDSSCSDGFMCKHAAALLASVAKGRGLKAVLSQLGGGVVNAELDEDFDRWVSELTAAETASAPKEPAEKVFYVFDLDGSGGVKVWLEVARVSADGVVKGQTRRPRVEGELSRAFDETDRVIVRRLAGYRRGSAGVWQAAEEGFAAVVQEILATGRARWQSAHGDPVVQGDQRDGRCTWQEVGDGESMVTAVLTQPRSDAVWAMGELWYLDVERREMGPVAVDAGRAAVWLKGPAIPADKAKEVAGRLEADGVSATFARPAEASVQRVSGPSRPELVVGPRVLTTPHLTQALGYEEGHKPIVANLVLNYGGHRISPLVGRADGVERLEVDDEIVLVQREPAEEGRVLRMMEQCGLMNLLLLQDFATADFDIMRGCDAGDRALWFPALRELTERQFWISFREHHVEMLEEEGWSVTFEGDLALGGGLEPMLVDDAGLELQLEQENEGWFSLAAGFEVGDRHYDLVPILRDLLEAGALDADSRILANETFLYYPSGSSDVLRLPSDRLRRILRLVQGMLNPFEMPTGKSGKPEVGLLEAAAMTEEKEVVVAPAGIVQLGDSLRRGDVKAADLVVPQGLQATLRSYQEEGFRWMQFLARHGLHGVLADDMGLGKTMQTLAHILAEKESGRSEGRPSLVVAPTSVVVNWQREAAKFAPSMDVMVLQGSGRKKLYAQVKRVDVVVISYALLSRDIERLEETEFHIAALDEAQHIKNASTKVSESARRLKARHRLCLSGTPIENNLGELWSLMAFLMPGLLRSQREFTADFRTPIEKHGDEERRDILVKRVGPLILRRTKDQVAKELPPKTEIMHEVALTTAQKDLYEAVRVMMDKKVRDAIASQGVESSQILFLDALLKLRQICCHPQLLKKREAQKVAESAKLDYLLEMLETMLKEGRKVLIFSQFTTMLEKIEVELKRRRVRYLILTGSTKDRHALVDQFQGGKAEVFLISLKAGGTGLTLTEADTVIHYDPWWNPAVENQATDRAYRIGQDKPVFVHKLICGQTVEQRIMEMQAKKSALADALLSGSATKLSLTEDAIKELLSPMEDGGEE